MSAATAVGSVLLGLGFVLELLWLTAGKKTARVFSFSSFWFSLCGVWHCLVEFADIFIGTKSIMETSWAGVALGPLSVLVAFGSVHATSWRYPLQLAVCTMMAVLGSTVQPGYLIFGTVHESDQLLHYGVIAVDYAFKLPIGLMWVDAFRKICRKTTSQ